MTNKPVLISSISHLGLFGEDAADRRERLRLLLAISGGPAQRPILSSSEAKNSTLTARDVSPFPCVPSSLFRSLKANIHKF